MFFFLVGKYVQTKESLGNKKANPFPGACGKVVILGK